MKPAASPPTDPARRAGSGGALADNEKWLGRVMMAPAILYIAALVGLPLLLALYYSVSNVTVGSAGWPSYVGLSNFRHAFGNPTFIRAVWNTIFFAVVSMAIVMVLGTILALSLLKDFRGKWFVRLLILLPWVAPISLGTIGWLWMFDSVYSVINWTAQYFGIFGKRTWPVWLGQPTLAMASVITVQVWRLLPLATVILLGGLSSIPKDIQEAALVDGASVLRRYVQITEPLMRPIALVALLFGLIFSFTDMIVIYVLTRGGPFDTTQVLATLAFFTGIDGGDLGGGAAIALFLLPVLAACVILILRFARKTEVT